MTLKRRYDRIMEHIEVTDDMRRRVLRNLREAQDRETGEAGQEAPAKMARLPPLEWPPRSRGPGKARAASRA